MKNQKCDDLLMGRRAICDYLHDMSKPVFYKFIEMGMLAVVIDGRCYANADNLDAFFKSVTHGQMKEIPEDAE